MTAKTQTTRLRGADVRLARGRAGLTQEVVAKRLRVYEAAMAEVENERLELAQHEYQRILGVIEELSGGTEQESQG